MTIKAIGFDFDGTLIKSEEQKAKEMAKVFKEKFGSSEGVEKAYIQFEGKARNRRDKIILLCRNLFKRNPTRKELQSLKKHFGEHYTQGLRTCPLFECTNLLKELKKQVKFLFLLSLEERREVAKVAKHCGVAKYFDEILGGPRGKAEHFLHVIKKHHIKPSEVIYIGDSHSDVTASKKAGIKVVLLGKKHTYERLKQDLEADFRFSSLCDVQINGLKKGK